jgi:asparagine N-glycosylation enzyme membrane subunit Stt3
VVIGNSGVCPAAAPSRRAAGMGDEDGRWPTLAVLVVVVMCQLVISAHRKPASFRAMAVTMTLAGLWWALMRR